MPREIGDLSCTTSCLVLPGFLMAERVSKTACQMRSCLLLFQVLVLFVALGVFLLRVRDTFVENTLFDVRELREIFMIIGGMYKPVI